MTRDPEEDEERPVKGGRAAERLREHLAARFGDKAPPIPPDEEEQPGEEPPAEEKPPSEPSDDAADRES